MFQLASGEQSINAITLNTFPSINSFTSPRAWFLAIIVLLHAGFVWMLSTGIALPKVAVRPPTIVDFLPDTRKPREAPPLEIPDAPVETRPDFRVTPPDTPIVDVRDDVITAPPVPPTDIIRRDDRALTAPAPVEIAPAIDSSRRLSEPLYPSSDIRAGNAGTVVLSVLVLENGRIGDVRLDQSSGHPRLDESAMREARRWRLKPGMRDGVPVAMWKQIPVTFRLRDAIKM